MASIGRFLNWYAASLRRPSRRFSSAFFRPSFSTSLILIFHLMYLSAHPSVLTVSTRSSIIFAYFSINALYCFAVSSLTSRIPDSQSSPNCFFKSASEARSSSMSLLKYFSSSETASRIVALSSVTSDFSSINSVLDFLSGYSFIHHLPFLGLAEESESFFSSDSLSFSSAIFSFSGTVSCVSASASSVVFSVLETTSCGSTSEDSSTVSFGVSSTVSVLETVSSVFSSVFSCFGSAVTSSAGALASASCLRCCAFLFMRLVSADF